jgi:electron-transferring-flavoprotein dehydrogenase
MGDDGPPLDTPVVKDEFAFLTKSGSIPMPTPPSMHNEGNYVISLSQLTRWLGAHAENLGVEIYPGFAASELLYDEQNAVVGIATGDQGIGKDGRPKDTFARGMELRAKQTLLAEGARGSLSELAMERFALRAECDAQGYGLGVKEVWEVPEEQCTPGFVMHTIGWPLQTDTYGGSFLYHMKPNLVLVGFVVGLDYPNPYTSPYEEFQRYKHHPKIAKHLKGGKCISYGARVINEGGFQSIPKLTFPGGALIGCSAGFVNVPRIKGSHTAMKSGIDAADAVFAQLKLDGGEDSTGAEVLSYSAALQSSWLWRELKAVRNYQPSFRKFGFWGFLAYCGLEAYVLKGRAPWTFRHTQRDCDATKPAAECTAIEYPQPDGKLSFDLLTNLQRSGVYHEEDQPSHLQVKPGMEDVPVSVSLSKYAGPESRFCPAKVYEYVDEKLVINAQNCIHCKTCSIKTPQEFIKWTVPEGAGGPNYDVQ